MQAICYLVIAHDKHRIIVSYRIVSYNGNSRDQVTCIAGCPHSFKYVPLVHGCYYFEQKMVNWHLANRYCTTRHPNSHQVVITSKVKQTAVSEFLFSKSGEYWQLLIDLCSTLFVPCEIRMLFSPLNLYFYSLTTIFIIPNRAFKKTAEYVPRSTFTPVLPQCISVDKRLFELRKNEIFY